MIPDSNHIATTSKLSPGLYIVATPIGNLRDITLRALDVLQAADVVVCEDTRVTQKLLTHFGIKKKLLVYNDHATAGMRTKIIRMLEEGQVVALVSDAGTPIVSDPGYRLVKEVLAKGGYVTSLPGASAPLTALTLCGLPSDQFLFAGFLPVKKQARKKAFSDLVALKATLIFFERGSRLSVALEEMHAVFGNRQAAVARELTKLYEEVRRGTLSELASFYTKTQQVKGEIVVLIAPGEAEEISPEQLDKEIKKLLKNNSLKEISNKINEEFGVSKKQVYARALELKGQE